MFAAALSPQQLIVINALSEGVNMTDAAAQAGVHRNTIAYWNRNSFLFRESLADAQYDRALLFRDKAEQMLDLAFQTLDGLLTDPKASPSVRLKAALFLIEKATTPPAPRKQVPLDIAQVHVHNPAQPLATTPPPAPAPTPVENPPSVHKNAQNEQSAEPPYRRETAKIGRNEPCPCGSGQKYKRCCLNKPLAEAA